MTTLEVRDLTKSFGATKALDRVSFAAPPGIVYGLVGRNGAGKTTTIRIIMDIYLPDSGAVLLGGKPRGADFYRRVGYLPEERGLYKAMSVLDNLLFLAEIKGVRPVDARPIALRFLERFELAKQANAALESLSKGNQQKVQFISTILHDPDLVILDEPFSGLDPVNIDLLNEMIGELKRAGKLIILSTHLMDIAEKLCDRVAMIDKGRLVLDDSPASIKARNSERKVSLQSDGDLSFLGKLPYVESVQRFGNSTTIRVRKNSAIQQLLRALVDADISVTRFQANETSLHDVFVSLTKGEDQPATRDSFTLPAAELEMAS